MDIKVGTRQFGDEASPEKRRHMMEKASRTTTSTLGLRICGQQVFQPRTRSYAVVNKYQGRKIAADSFGAALRQFFFDGSCYRTDVLLALIERLRRLLASYQSTPTAFRFYSTSLLLMYEGEPSNAADPMPRVDVRMIDFAHTHRYEPGTELDDGYLFGLRNLLHTLCAIQASLASDLRPTVVGAAPPPRRASAGSLMCPAVSCKVTGHLARSRSADYIALH
eukprot:TRINITY_DN3910_c0_g1_i2.p1 TRINITY_DN3910_c0_g1~~TRINITY_DN3910_c0_g1_i2.p1  ORF type:complete len:222 (+),score=91.66 TRINITY_DN3910_c0_g1_i2:205-870(+)